MERNLGGGEGNKKEKMRLLFPEKRVLPDADEISEDDLGNSGEKLIPHNIDATFEDNEDENDSDHDSTTPIVHDREMNPPREGDEIRSVAFSGGDLQKRSKITRMEESHITDKRKPRQSR